MAAACSSDSPDADPVADEPSDTAEAVNDLVSEAPAEPDEAEASPESVDAVQGDAAAVVSEPATDRVDVGEFNDYEPADPDPTLLGVDPDVAIGTLDNGMG